MVFLTRKTGFSLGHRYYLPDLSPEENRRLFGLCALPHGHGHDYTLEVTFGGEVDPANGMVVNISDIKPLLEREVVQPLDGQFLTAEHPLMAGRIPCAETLARWIWNRLEDAAARDRIPARLERVRLMEYRRLWADCFRGENGPMVTLTRTYEFAAAHRLDSPHLSAAENRELFGKCNNPNGHGHNYELEVTVGGEPDPRTGFLIDLGLLDRVVNEQVVDRYDHRHLNLDIEEFRELNPTSENLVRVIWHRLQPALPPGALRRVTVRETDRNIFTYEGKDA
ncbi:MAG TPA: 6-carboxytetrahydropterin synthase [Armatimonadota bacterium]|nr:6-carboxytetrahydropterin synthase [Armatimonadota bacterium]